jgi:hypothetical protein
MLCSVWLKACACNYFLNPYGCYGIVGKGSRLPCFGLSKIFAILA